MSAIKEINFTGDAQKLLKDLLHVNLKENESATNTSSSTTSDISTSNDDHPLPADMNAKALAYIMQTLRSIDDKFATLTSEINSLKKEIMDSHKTISDQRQEIEDLKKTNLSLTQKLNDNEMHARSNALLLSGPMVYANNEQSPQLLRDKVVQDIKNVYDFDLPKAEISNCVRIRGKVKTNDRIILSLTNNFVKSDLMSKVIQSDKRNGVTLNINEHLSQYNSDLLYRLRTLRKANPNKIFACFSRNGRIFYKAHKDSKPNLISKPDDVTSLANELAQHGTLLRRPPLNHGNQTQQQQ